MAVKQAKANNLSLCTGTQRNHHRGWGVKNMGFIFQKYVQKKPHFDLIQTTKQPQ